MASSSFPDFGLTHEERRRAVLGHYYEQPGMDGARGEIWCYTDRYSYRAGETITLFVSATAERYRLDIVRDGGVETPMASVEGLSAQWQDTPDQCSVLGCGWTGSHSLRIPLEWTSGAYRITLTAEGRDGRLIRCHHLFILRPQTGAKPGRILQVAATGTWTAYNTWGGSNHYQGITGPARNQYAPMVSIERPFCRGFVVLPPEAPRVPLEVSIPPAMPPRYPHMEWAYAHGYSKKYASSGWASYDSHFFRWAERTGYAVDLASQHELHFEPEILDGYDCVVFVGHDEYWTWEMRDAVEHYAKRGGKVARFAGNFMWQTRLEDEGRRQVCFKYRAEEDPILAAGGDLTRLSTSWEDPRVGRPGSETFGLLATRGLYVGWGGCAPRGARGFPIYRPEHWAFAGTGIYYGDILGADSHIFGYEVDGLDYVIEGGLPRPADNSFAPEGLQILGLGMSSLKEESADIPADDQFLSDEDARFVARTLIGDDQAASVDKVKRGAGMMVNFPMGKGEIFHAGTCEWVAGLLRRDPMVERVTANIMNRYLGGD